MKEISSTRLVEEMSYSDKDVLFIASPNYETRSTAFFETFVALFNNQTRAGKIHLGILSLQSRVQQNLVLDKIKWRRVYKIQKELGRLEGRRFSWSQKTITYPQNFSSDQFGMLLNSWSKGLSRPFVVCIDISGLPRTIILDLIQNMHDWVAKGILSKWYLIYAWPEKYPNGGRPAAVGSLRLAEGGLSLSDFINGGFDVRGVVVPGRDGHSSSLFIDTLPPNSQIDAYVYLAKDSIRSSLETIYANFTFWSDIAMKTDANVNYLLSIARGHQILISHAKELYTRTDQDEDNVYLIAPFGPKLFMLSSYVAKLIAFKSGWRAGIVLWGSHQYVDLYSIGFSRISCFEIDLKEFTSLGPL